MATLVTQPVIGDVGSAEVQQLRVNYNNLLDVLGTLITGLKTAADAPAINALATTAETSLQNTVAKIGSQPNVPLYKEMPDLRPSTRPAP